MSTESKSLSARDVVRHIGYHRKAHRLAGGQALDILTDTEIQYLGKKLLRNWGGVFSKDMLPKVVGDGSYVVNLQGEHEGDQRGTHWVCFVKDGVDVQYFDSYGVEPPLQVSAVGEVSFNPYDFQGIRSKLCGWFDLYFLIQMQSAQNNMSSVLRKFGLVAGKYEANDNYIKQWAQPYQSLLKRLKRKPGSFFDTS